MTLAFRNIETSAHYIVINEIIFVMFPRQSKQQVIIIIVTIVS